ncbi:bacillithiol system redox-active protein YtxJ [Flavobacterium sp. TP390]|uniref:Bacillithiol system redox-active protein YtxJ n=1 Tax=Flavobacterium profundi TaxID=1774945 RepID=A0A6I4IV01_9FLAO|nr:bacillithiol system redox-active protein YtxJ [Flavobacterium profundi]MVO10635.1 bacillithiol system redox-active protein YtxJ [Flavobacterium profundi]
MSFLNKIFGSSNQENPESNSEPKFHTLTDIEELDTIDTASFEKPIVLFKHSTRCSISRFALKQFDNAYHFTNTEMEWYLLDLLNYREVSNAIANRYDVMHQSPQILVIKNGKVIYTASHDAIDATDLKQFVG